MAQGRPVPDDLRAPAGSREENASEKNIAHAVAPLNKAYLASPSADRAIPPYCNGMRVGLLGGSFNPPHLAHRAISLFAIKRLKLDRVWWLVTPGNPLKDGSTLHKIAERAEAAQRSAHWRQLSRIRHRNAIRCRHREISASPGFGSPFCLDHGRR
jgi:hypothetical protein